MSIVYRETGKGITIAEQSSDETAMQMRLTHLDDRLVLTKERDPINQVWVWKVLYRVSDDLPWAHICDWRDDFGRPLPLSSGLLDKVQSLRPENRGKRVDADTHNERLKQQRSRDADASVDAVADDYRKLLWGDTPDPHNVGGIYGMHKPTRRFGAK